MVLEKKHQANVIPTWEYGGSILLGKCGATPLFPPVFSCNSQIDIHLSRQETLSNLFFSSEIDSLSRPGFRPKKQTSSPQQREAPERKSR